MYNLEEAVLDEIALEGLDGVSLERLWDLLEQRLARFDFRCDDYIKNFIWDDLLCHHETISFYTVPEELLQLVESDIKKRITSRKKGQLKVHQPSGGLIDDPVTKEMGYCPFYDERQDVTAEIRKNTKSGALSLQQSTNKWGNTLVLVASQEARIHAILSPVTSADFPLSTTYYCCMEFVGKNRYLGAAAPNISAKFDVTFSYVFHMCKKLAKLGVVTKEVKGNVAYIYLIRFKKQPVKEVTLSSMILDFIEDQPYSMVPRYELVDFVLSHDYSYGQFKKVLRNLKSSNVVEAAQVAAKDLPQYCPETVQSVQEYKKRMVQEEDNTNKERNPEEFQIVCIRLLKQGNGAKDRVGNDGDDDADDDDDFVGAEVDFSKLHLDMELSDVQQVYYYVEKKENESNGVSMNEITHALTMDRAYVRGLFKILIRENLVKGLNFVTGKARELRYFTQRGIDEATVPEGALKLYHQQQNIPPNEKQTPVKDEVSGDPLPMDAGQSSDPFKSSPGVSHSTGKPTGISRKSGTSFKQTLKNLERSRLVLDLVTCHHILEEYHLLKRVKKKEAEAGMTAICCRKSLHRMILNMAEEGKINYFTKEIKRKCKSGLKTEVIKIVSDAAIKDGDPRVQDLLEKISPKQKFGTPPVEVPVMYRKLKQKSGKHKIAMSDLLRSKMYHNLEKRKNMERYGFCSKMERVEALHKYLWYLLYGSKEEGIVKLEPMERLSTKETTALPQGCKDETEGQAHIMLAGRIRVTAATNDESPISNDEEMEENPTNIACYQDTEDWRRYVTPGIEHIGWAKGWATMNDILSTLPLSIFVKINSVTNEVPGLDEALKHPRIRHYPINILHLQLFYGSDVNRIINNVHACLVNLSGMGLLYFDCDQRLQNRTRVNFYLCQTGSFLDTTSSAPGSIQIEEKDYPKRSYKFTSMESVEQFWLDFKMNCFTTPLGAFRYQAVKDAAKENKMLIMVAETVHKVPPEPITIPGDCRGAAGLDTTFYAHRSNNWDKIRCQKSSKKQEEKVSEKSKIKREAVKKAKDLASEGGGAKCKEKVKVVKVSATEHKKATVGGKGQKRKRQKATPTAEKPTAEKPQVNLEGVPVSGPAVESTSANQNIEEKADKRSKEQKKVGSDFGPKDGDLVVGETADGSMVKNVNQRSEEQNKVASDYIPTDPEQVEGETVDENMVEKANKKSKGQKKMGPKRAPRSHLIHDLHIYDETDMLATNKKILRRVKWSAREDNLLLLCALALRFLKVKVAKSGPLKQFVPMSEVRDMLRENLESSCDKTSESCSRRLRVLLKDDTNMSNFSVCLTDIRADKEIMSEFMTQDKAYDDEAVRRKEFKDLCVVLGKKFESQSKDTILSIPSTLEELYQTYDLINSNLPVEKFESKDVKSEDDITHNLLFTVVLISMLSHHFRQGEMKEIYYALRQYDPKQLQRAVDTFKSHGFMGRNRGGMQDTTSPQRALHVIPMSFQFTKTFFNLFNAPSIPAKILDETSMALDDIVARKRALCYPESDETCTATLTLDEMKGNRSSLLCIPALELATDSVDIPKDIISLDLSAGERAHLQMRHEEEMMLAVEDGDFEEEDDDSLSGKSREGKRKASEITENVAPMKLRRQLVDNIGRKKIAFVRTAHKEWCQTVADKQQTSEHGKKKVTMKSLIPRLLSDVNMEKITLDASSVKPTIPSEAPVSRDTLSAARRSLALDHDYFMAKVDKTPGTCQDEINPEDSSQVTPEVFLEDSIQVDETASQSSASTDGTSRTTKSNSFFNWLTMRGFLTSDYTKKPQNIHEDIIVRRCSVYMKPTARLTDILDRFHVPSKQEHNEQDQVYDTKDASHQRIDSSQPIISSSEGKCMDSGVTDEHGNPQTAIQSRNGTSEGNLVPSERSMSLSSHSEINTRTSRTTTSPLVQTLGELIHQSCGPVQAFLCPQTSSDFRPSFRYTINSPCKSLEDVCKGHEDHSHLLTIYKHVKGAGSLGLTYPQLLHSLCPYTHHERTRVFSCLRILLQEQLLLEVGTSFVRLVAQKNASNWLLKSVKTVPLATTTTPPDNSGLVSPAKKTKLREQSISQGEVTNGDQSVRDELQRLKEGEVLQDVHCETNSTNQVQTDEILMGASINSRGEGSEFESDKDASERKQLETKAKDNEASGLKGKKRKKGDKKERIQPVEVKYEPVSVLCHPWTNIDGSTSIKSLIMFLSSVGLMIISKPGIKESDIFHHYQATISPVDCLHLVKILMNANIITRHSTYSSVKLNLFGAPLNTKPKAVFFYQPTVAALMNLALLKENLANSEKKDS